MKFQANMQNLSSHSGSLSPFRNPYTPQLQGVADGQFLFFVESDIVGYRSSKTAAMQLYAITIAPQLEYHIFPMQCAVVSMARDICDNLTRTSAHLAAAPAAHDDYSGY